MAIECPKSQLMFFEPKGIQYSILQTEQVALKPLASIEKASIIQFLDQGYGDDYRNLSSVYLHLRVEMDYLSATNEAPAAGTVYTQTSLPAYPVNNFLHSLFKQVTLTLNGKMVAQNSQNYAYR